MSFYSYNNSTGELLEVSDFPIPSLDDTSVSEVGITRAHLEAEYTWNLEARMFEVKTFTRLTKKEFLKKFTSTEYATIKAATQANAEVDYYWQLFIIAEEVVLNDPDTVQGIYALEMMGLLAPGRAQEILG